MKRTENGYTLSTGRKIDAHDGILGICPEDSGLFNGYDDRNYFGLDDDDEYGQLTPEERSEIASFMSALWLEWAQKRDTP